MAGAKGRKWKCRSRPCSVCRKWFTPDPRARKSQTVCGRDECRRERHRRACARWRAANPDYDREDRLRRRLRPEDEQAESAQIDWSVVRDVVGLEVAVVVEESSQVIARVARDDIVRQLANIKSKSTQILLPPARDEMAARPPPT